MASCLKCKKEINDTAVLCPFCQLKTSDEAIFNKKPLKYRWLRESIMAFFIFGGWLYCMYHPYMWSSAHNPTLSYGDLVLMILSMPFVFVFGILSDTIKHLINYRPGVAFAWIVGFALSYVTAKGIYWYCDEEYITLKKTKPKNDTKTEDKGPTLNDKQRGTRIG